MGASLDGWVGPRSRKRKACFFKVDGEIFGHNRLEFLVFASPTRLHVDILRFSFIELGYIL